MKSSKERKMGKTEQLLALWMARNGICGVKELAIRTGFSEGRICQIKKDLGGLPCRGLLVIGKHLKLSDEEIGQLVRSQQ